MAPMQGRLLAITGLLLASLVLVAGCGGESEPPPPGTPSAAEFLVDASLLNEQTKGSPEEALLLWWRSIQYNDLQGYLGNLTAPLRKQREAQPNFPRELALVSGELQRAQPQIGEVEESDGIATVYTRIESRVPVGSSDFTTSSSPQAFTLTREGKAWKVDDDFYVLNKAELIHKAQQEAEAAK
jgi:hypothetical protein